MRRLTELILKVDFFKEPTLHEHKRKIVEKGTMIGVFFTVVGFLSMIMCLWFVVSFYDDYVKASNLRMRMRRWAQIANTIFDLSLMKGLIRLKMILLMVRGRISAH
jgi:hypothetical protein